MDVLETAMVGATVPTVVCCDGGGETGDDVLDVAATVLVEADRGLVEEELIRFEVAGGGGGDDEEDEELAAGLRAEVVLLGPHATPVGLG